MAYTDTVTHLKFLRLQERLGLPVPHVLGHLEMVWQYTHAHSQTRLGVMFLPGEVERVALWGGVGEPGALEKAMLETGWLDPHGEHVAVHNWFRHAPDFAKKRLRRREGDRTTADNVRTVSAETPPELERNGTGTEGERNQNGTPKGTDPKRTGPEPPAVSGSVSASAALNAGRNSGAEPVGDILARLQHAGASRDADMLASIMRLTGEPEEYRGWWAKVLDRMGETDGKGVLWEAVQEAEKRADPAQRRAKDLGELDNPGAFIASKCKAWLGPRGKSLPPKPKPTAGPG